MRTWVTHLIKRPCIFSNLAWDLIIKTSLMDRRVSSISTIKWGVVPPHSGLMAIPTSLLKVMSILTVMKRVHTYSTSSGSQTILIVTFASQNCTSTHAVLNYGSFISLLAFIYRELMKCSEEAALHHPEERDIFQTRPFGVSLAKVSTLPISFIKIIFVTYASAAPDYTGNLKRKEPGSKRPKRNCSGTDTFSIWKIYVREIVVEMEKWNS